VETRADAPYRVQFVVHEGETQDVGISAGGHRRGRIVYPEGAKSYPLCLKRRLRWVPVQASSVTQRRTLRQSYPPHRPDPTWAH
jgi:hypothetical protein